MSNLRLDPTSTALVAIDLQNGIVGLPTQPYAASEVVENSRRLSEQVRKAGGEVIYVRVDLGNLLHLPVDSAQVDPDAPVPPPIASELSGKAGFREGDLVITKRHWGAFAGTELEAHLKRRGIETVIVTGIATNIGVESTVRQGTGLGFAFVVVEDACTAMDAEAHRAALEKTMPGLARVRKTHEVIAALA